MKGSDWARRLGKQNQVAFPNSTEDPNLRHFIVACHEGVAECLARKITVEPVRGSFDDALVLATQRLASS